MGPYIMIIAGVFLGKEDVNEIEDIIKTSMVARRFKELLIE